MRRNGGTAERRNEDRPVIPSAARGLADGTSVLSVALTGNIAAGKSAVAELFRRWGATVLDADAIVREVQTPGGPVMRRIVERFGEAVVGPDGSLDRPALRRIVMADVEAREALERIVHPAVHARRAELAEEAAARGDRIVVSDIPLLFETGAEDAFDAVVLVDAAEPVRLRRLVEHRGLSEAEARDMIRAQLPASAKRARSDFVIENDGDRVSASGAPPERSRREHDTRGIAFDEDPGWGALRPRGGPRPRGIVAAAAQRQDLSPSARSAPAPELRAASAGGSRGRRHAAVDRRGRGGRRLAR